MTDGQLTDEEIDAYLDEKFIFSEEESFDKNMNKVVTHYCTYKGNRIVGNYIRPIFELMSAESGGEPMSWTYEEWDDDQIDKFLRIGKYLNQDRFEGI